jgi:aspartate aminotransferase
MDSNLSKRSTLISPSPTLALDAQAKQMKAAGEDVISFCAGEPDFDTPQHIKDAAAKALADGFTKYTPSSGIPELRKAIAQKFALDNGIRYEPSEIIVSCGAKHSCYNVFLALCNEGDEVIIPAPYWVSYPEMARLVGADPFIVPTTEAAGFKITPDQFREAISPSTKLLVLNSPGNPTGAVYTREELEALVAVAAEDDIFILSDEIYEKLVYGGATHVSPASLSDAARRLVITVNGFSKTFAMTGWRLGYLGAPEPIARAIDSIQSHATSNPTSFAQKGALAALTNGHDFLAQWVLEFDRRRQRFTSGLNAIEGIRCPESLGAFYLFPNISSFGITSAEFAARLLDQQKMAVVPGSAFGTEGYIRISYACSSAQIEQGLERLARFCAALK